MLVLSFFSLSTGLLEFVFLLVISPSCYCLAAAFWYTFDVLSKERINEIEIFQFPKMKRKKKMGFSVKCIEVDGKDQVKVLFK